MATHSSILARKSMDREDGLATTWGCKEYDMTERLTLLLSFSLSLLHPQLSQCFKPSNSQSFSGYQFLSIYNELSSSCNVIQSESLIQTQ